MSILKTYANIYLCMSAEILTTRPGNIDRKNFIMGPMESETPKK